MAAVLALPTGDSALDGVVLASLVGVASIGLFVTQCISSTGIAFSLCALLPQLATDGMDAIPILEGDRIVGVVTQTDLIAALARHSLRQGDGDQPLSAPALPA